MVRKYVKKASEKIGQTMHEFKRGKLKSGSGKKVTSRKQAIAIGLSQARRAGYKVPPPPRGHATMSLDARVRAYLSNMRPGAEIDARGIARAIGGVNPLEADYALERAQKAGLAVTSDGRWFGPRGGSSSRAGHARKKTPAQLDREIAETLSDTRRGRSHSTIKHDRDDARMFGRHAYRMEQTKAKALSSARTEGFAAHQLDAVEDGWEAERRDTTHGGFSGASAHATRRQVEVDTSVYRRYHGAEPRGSGNWTFVIGKREYAHSDDPALYRPAESRGAYKGGRPTIPFAKAKEHAIAEAKRRGATIIGVGP